jgi:xylulokinase
MQQSGPLILTVDLGTSGPKVAVYNTNVQCIAHEFEEVPLYLYEHGGAEQKPHEWTNAITNCYKRLITKHGIDPKSIVAINCTAQWSGTVAVAENGEPLMDSVIWMDTRGAEYIKQLTHGPIRVEGYGIGKILKWVRLTGGGPTRSGKDAIAHILYIKGKLPEIYNKTYKFLEPKDYLNVWLTGIHAASFDSILTYWITDNRDINKIDYHPDLVRLSGIDRKKLPDLVPTNTVLGKVRKEIAELFGLNPDVKVISGTPDVLSAAIGSGAVRDYEGHFYIGTSSWLVTHIPFQKSDVFHNVAAIPSGIPGRYLVANEQESAGACLNFLKNNIFYHQDEMGSNPAPKDFYKLVDRMVDKVPAGADKLYFLPWLYGERTPVDDHSVRGGFYNMSLNHNRGHMMRAVVEGITLNGRWLLFYVEKLMGRKFEAINFIGGGANSAVWSQINADIFNRPVRQMKDPLMSNSRGTAILALLALNYIDINRVSEVVEFHKTFEPNPKHRGMYDEMFGRFVEIYNKNKPIYAKLNP